MTSVLVVDDHVLVRDGLRRVLEAHGLSVVGEASDADEAVTKTAGLRPDVLLMDVSLPHRTGIAAAREISARFPEMGIIFLSMFDDDDTIAAAAVAGARGYLVKNCTITELTASIEAVARRVDLLERYRQPNVAVGRESRSLTVREVEVLQLAASGVSTANIASALFVSIKTVRNHLASIYEKLRVHNKTEAIIEGMRLGLADLPHHAKAQETKHRK